MISINKTDKIICRRLQENFPMIKQPYKKLSVELNIPEKKLIERISELKQMGIIRKFNAFLNHKKACYLCNVLAGWKVPEKRIKQTADICVKFKQVSHCYKRLTRPGWKYNLYTMVHGHDKNECEKVVKSIALKSKINDFKLLYSKKEYKKTSVACF